MNDLKTLYNACSDKDELAQIAEKLNIEGNANLATVLNKIIDAIPEGCSAEPLILTGTAVGDEDMEDYSTDIHYNDNQDPGDIVVDAIESGRSVFLNYTSDGLGHSEVNEHHECHGTLALQAYNYDDSGDTSGAFVFSKGLNGEVFTLSQPA